MAIIITDQVVISVVNSLIVQKTYCFTDGEALSLMLAVRNFHVYMGAHAVVFFTISHSST